MSSNLLGFLNCGPQSGSELKQLMDKSTGYVWHAKQSEIYMTLKNMEPYDVLVQSRKVLTIPYPGVRSLYLRILIIALLAWIIRSGNRK